VNVQTVTPRTESFQAVVRHLLVTHPGLKSRDQVGVDSRGSLRRAALLNHDGVLKKAIVCDGRPYPAATPHEVELVPGMKSALPYLGTSCRGHYSSSSLPSAIRGRFKFR